MERFIGTSLTRFAILAQALVFRNNQKEISQGEVRSGLKVILLVSTSA